MDSKDRREMIVRLKDNDGKTFTEISDTLYENLGVKITRQAVYGIYKRAKRNANKIDRMEYTNKVILRVFARTGSITDTQYAMIELEKSDCKIQGDKCSYSYICRLVADHHKEIKEIKDEIKECIVSVGYENEKLEEIKQLLTFRDVQISDSVMAELVTEIAVKKITQFTRKEIAYIIDSSDGDTSIAKNVIKQLNETELIGSIVKFKNEVIR